MAIARQNPPENNAMILERELSLFVRFEPEKEAFDCRCSNPGFLKVNIGIASSSSGLKTTGRQHTPGRQNRPIIFFERFTCAKAVDSSNGNAPFCFCRGTFFFCFAVFLPLCVDRIRTICHRGAFPLMLPLPSRGVHSDSERTLSSKLRGKGCPIRRRFPLYSLARAAQSTTNPSSLRQPISARPLRRAPSSIESTEVVMSPVTTACSFKWQRLLLTLPFTCPYT